MQNPHTTKPARSIRHHFTNLARTLAAIAAMLLTFTTHAAPLGTAFTYQGRLTDNGAPAAGSYEFEFTLFDALTAGTQLGVVTVEEVQVVDGIFTVNLDFGAAAFNGDARWLEIFVRKDTDGLPGAMLTPRQEIMAVPYALMAKDVPNGAITSAKLAGGAVTAGKIAAGAVGTTQLATGAVTSAQIADGGVQMQHLAPGSVGAAQLGAGAAFQNLLVNGQSPVAGGGVILSESAMAPALVNAGYSQIGKADLVAEAWRGMAAAPDGPPAFDLRRQGNATVWTGTEMLVWGGDTNVGGRYNPTTNTWTPMSTVNAPAARRDPTAVWTGTEMLVWGGRDGSTLVGTGGRYNPATNTWTTITTTNAPAARKSHTAVWTGSLMIIWGGTTAAAVAVADGARYNPATNTWSNVSSGSPLTLEDRSNHFAVWTGTEMLVVGGRDFTIQVERYAPATNSWTVTVPFYTGELLRNPVAATWTGTEFLILERLGGGFARIARINLTTNAMTRVVSGTDLSVDTGCTIIWDGTRAIIWSNINNPNASYSAVYTPGTNTLSDLSQTLAPRTGIDHIAIWTGSRMIIWGGSVLTGGRYDPATNTWEVMAKLSEDGGRTGGYSSVWTGSELLIWGGTDSGGSIVRGGMRFNPATDSWALMSAAGAPSARANHSAVWTGSEMIVWGGGNAGGHLDDGARYNPATDTWTPLATDPSARSFHRAIWTGSEMIIWGGTNGFSLLANGARYSPATDSWTPLPTANAPSARSAFALVWTGTEMILWGGGNLGVGNATGGRYNPATNIWTPTSMTNVPPGRSNPTAVWSGKEMIIFGGGGDFGVYPTANARYNPATNTWTAMSTTSAPSPRTLHSAVWAGTKMIVWGGENAGGYVGLPGLGVGGIYSPETDTWSGTILIDAPTARSGHAAVWAGSTMLLWGGTDITGALQDTFTYTPKGTYYLYVRP